MSIVAAFPSKLFPAFRKPSSFSARKFQITMRDISSFTAPCFLAISSRYTHLRTYCSWALARASLTILCMFTYYRRVYICCSCVLMCSRRGSFPRAPSHAIGVVWRAHTVCAAIQIKGNRRVWCLPLADPQKRRNTPRHVYDGVL